MLQLEAPLPLAGMVDGGLLLALALGMVVNRYAFKAKIFSPIFGGKYRRSFLTGLVIVLAWMFFWAAAESFYIKLQPSSETRGLIYPGAHRSGIARGLEDWPKVNFATLGGLLLACFANTLPFLFADLQGRLARSKKTDL